MQKLSVSESYKRRQENYSIPLIDVRTPAEYRANHATGSLNHPMESLDLNHLPFSKEEEVHVICQSGGRSIKVCKKMEAAGFQKVVNIEGGTSAWLASNLPTIIGNKVISLERQVRIAAGLLVVIGVAVGQFAHPGGFGLAAFIGAGLVFAGITDTCGMGMLIARMPWNQA